MWKEVREYVYGILCYNELFVNFKERNVIKNLWVGIILDSMKNRIEGKYLLIFIGMVIYKNFMLIWKS